MQTARGDSQVTGSEIEARGIFHDIVVGVDGSRPAQTALSLALNLRAGDARMLVMSVAEIHAAAHTGAEAAVWTSWIRSAAHEVRDECAAALDDLPNTSVRGVDGRPTSVLLQEASLREADLLAVGAGRSGRVAGLFFGSTATHLARHAPCSVLIARGEANALHFPERIVVGVDGSTPAADAEAVALALGDAHGAGVRRLMATGGEHLYSDRVVRAEVDARWPVEALVDASREADLIVVGSRGLRGIASLGSVAERVAHQAECPVLIVRGPRPDPAR